MAQASVGKLPPRHYWADWFDRVFRLPLTRQNTKGSLKRYCCLPPLAHRLRQKPQHAGEFFGGFLLRAVACVSAAGGGVKMAGGVVGAQLGVEFERVGGVHADRRQGWW